MYICVCVCIYIHISGKPSFFLMRTTYVPSPLSATMHVGVRSNC